MQIIGSSFSGRPTFVMLQINVVSREVGCLFLFCLYNRNSFFRKHFKETCQRSSFKRARRWVSGNTL